MKKKRYKYATRCTTCRKPRPKGGCKGCVELRETLSRLHHQDAAGADLDKRLAIHRGRAAGITAMIGGR